MTKLSTLWDRLQIENFYWKVGFYGLVLAGVFHALFIPLFLYLGLPVMAAVNVLSVAVYWYAIFGLGMRTLDTGDDGLIGWLVYFELTGHNLLASWYLGSAAGFQYYIYILAVIPFFVFTYPRAVYTARIAFVIALALLIDAHPAFAYAKITISATMLHALHHFNLLVFLSVLSLLSYLYAVHARTHQSTLEEGAARDHLTGLFNRRQISRRSARALETGRAGVLLIDIDHFKRVNDTYGHACGDRTIVHVARLLRREEGEGVVAARWGGEEFLLLFERTDEAGLQRTAERIRRAVESDAVPLKTAVLKITVTVGGAVMREGESFDDLLHRADRALYEGKNAGRNCIRLS